MNKIKLMLVAAALHSATLGADTYLDRFSESKASSIPAAWQPYTFPGEVEPTEFSIAFDADLQQNVLQADANASVSGMAHELEVDLSEQPFFHFAWKVDSSVAAADLTSKEGDDYAARVYVLFDYPRSRLSWGTRVQLSLAEKLYGSEIPTAALIYVWDNKHPPETTVANAYTDRARMIVLDSGDQHAGSWRYHRRDVAADFERAFGESAPAVSAVVVASDTDNTSSQARAYFADLYFSDD